MSNENKIEKVNNFMLHIVGQGETLNISDYEIDGNFLKYWVGKIDIDGAIVHDRFSLPGVLPLHLLLHIEPIVA